MFLVTQEIFLARSLEICSELQCAKKITFFCGAGVSTSAGIPDFRSENGLYSRTFGHSGTSLSGRELFEGSTLESVEKIAVLNRVAVDIRMFCRRATSTIFHQTVAALNSHGQLQQCYTQNIDGMQTRDFPELVELVHELHGSNQRLRCNLCGTLCMLPVDSLDEQLKKTGLVPCPNCKSVDEEAQARKKRSRPIGHLIPDLLYNNQQLDMSQGGTGLAAQLESDSSVDLLIIVGTSLKTSGAFYLVKRMAQATHEIGGAVVYVDRANASQRLASFVDIHLCVDIEVWSAHMMSTVGVSVGAKSRQLRDRLTSLERRIASPGTFEPGLSFSPMQPGDQHSSDVPLVVLLLHKRDERDCARTFQETLVSAVSEVGVQVGNPSTLRSTPPIIAPPSLHSAA
ncbi:hypothetical protein FRC12_001639 [Ceratobasidium sp. 428]|nr:hypothetical protein FRC12_001639 [Ceratobasidium sp. 428]